MKTLLYLEKTSTGDKKKTYIKIPLNHPKYFFPYNIEDRISYLNKKIRIIFSETQNIDITTTKSKLVLTSAKVTDEQHTQLLKLKGELKNKKYVFDIL